MFSKSVSLFQVWNLQTMELIQELTGLNHWVRALVASERHLFSGSYQTIKVLSQNVAYAYASKRGVSQANFNYLIQ